MGQCLLKAMCSKRGLPDFIDRDGGGFLLQKVVNHNFCTIRCDTKEKDLQLNTGHLY